MRNARTIIKMSFIACCFFLLSGYFYLQSKDYFSGPEIVIFYPENRAVLDDSYVLLRGKIENANSLAVNGNTVLSDADGNFQTALLLAEGYNIIDLTAKDKFMRVINKKIEVVLK